MLLKVEARRQLAAQTPVRSVTLHRSAMLAQIKAMSDQEVPELYTRAQGILMQAMGWVPPGYDSEKGSMELLQSQLAGYYDPTKKTMFLAQDLPVVEARATLAHELVHALQDQHYDLGPKLKFRPESGDEPTALQSLAEGDATSAMMDVLLGDSSRTILDLEDLEVAQSIQEQAMEGDHKIPPILKASLIAPYVDGFLFVQALRRRGGWAEVDRIWKNPPITTEQLLHLEKYDAHEPPLRVPPPPLDALGGGFQKVVTDRMGEQSLRIVLESWGSLREARRGAAGWGGDRISLLSREVGGQEEFFVTWWIRFDGESARCSHAEEAFRIISRGISPSSKPAGSVCRERTEMGPLVAAFSGCDVLLAAGPFVRSNTSWKSQGNCGAVEKWAVEAVKPSR